MYSLGKHTVTKLAAPSRIERELLESKASVLTIYTKGQLLSMHLQESNLNLPAVVQDWLPLHQDTYCLVRPLGLEPSTLAWQARMLPLTLRAH